MPRTLDLISRRRRASLKERVEVLYTRYFVVVSGGDLRSWPAFFAPDAIYKVWPKEGLTLGRPMPLLYLKGTGMISDRATCIRETLYYQPREISCDWKVLEVTGVSRRRGLRRGARGRGGAEITATGKFGVDHAVMGQPPRKVVAGEFRDTIVPGAGRDLVFSERQIVYLNRVIPGSLVYPL